MMNFYLKFPAILLVTVGLVLCLGCSDDDVVSVGYPDNVMDFLTEIKASNQRSGNAAVGQNYLAYGDFIKSGIPRSIYNLTGGTGVNELGRDGNNTLIPFDYTSVTTDTNVEVVAPNCYQCHAGYVDGQFMIGLGNTAFDFTTDQSGTLSVLDNLVENGFGKPSAEWDAYFPFSRAVKATGNHLIMETVGANSADKLALVLGAHRDQEDLTWIDLPQYEIPTETIPSDVPAWWLLKKKSAMFSTAIGQGDYAKMMMASSVLTMKDTSEARSIDQQFVNVRAFIESIEAPTYSGTIDQDKAERGRLLFENNCTVCHGTYGDDPTYTTYLVDHSLIGTDKSLAESNYAYADFENWFNGSWFGTDQHGAQLVPGNGYVAQPLDGIWATAPYLHNGSVPTLADLLNSKTRPEYWSRTLNFNSYDHQKVGWHYEVEVEKKNRFTYDTTLLGYGNKGHTFGDHLTDTERNDLLEYLKTI